MLSIYLMAAFSSSKLSSGNAVFVACEGVCMPCTATVVPRKSEGCTLLLHYLNENINDKLVLICFMTATKHRWSALFTL